MCAETPFLIDKGSPAENRSCATLQGADDEAGNGSLLLHGCDRVLDDLPKAGCRI